MGLRGTSRAGLDGLRMQRHRDALPELQREQGARRSAGCIALGPSTDDQSKKALFLARTNSPAMNQKWPPPSPGVELLSGRQHLKRIARTAESWRAECYPEDKHKAGCTH